LRNAPILVLDEATSALDSEIEAAIQSSLDTLMAGKTVIAIAHRLSTIARMDRLVVLDRGRIAEQGTGSRAASSTPHMCKRRSDLSNDRSSMSFDVRGSASFRWTASSRSRPRIGG
jgi:ABC-type multidrug transport system fused ATPase/permease subunit